MTEPMPAGAGSSAGGMALRRPEPRVPPPQYRNSSRATPSHRKRAQNGNACQRCYDSKTKCCGQFPCERCFKFCLPCRPRPRINGAAPAADSALAMFLSEHRLRVQQQRAAARAERRAQAVADGVPAPLEDEEEGSGELVLDAEGAIVGGPPLTLEEIADTSPGEARALLDLVVTRADGPRLMDGYLKAVVWARNAGRVHIPSAIATIRAWRRLSRVVGADVSLGLSVAAARVLGLTAADLGEGSVDGITGGNVVHQVEEPGMNAAMRRYRAAGAAQQAAQAAACIRASPFYRALAGSGPVPNCRGATPHRGAGVLLLCRTEAGGGGAVVGAGAMGGSFHLVANKSFSRYLPDPTALMEDAYRARFLPSLLLGGFLDPADRAAWFHALVDAFFTEPPPMPQLGPDGLPPLPPAQPAYHADFIKVFDRSGDMKLVMARFARVSTTAGGLGLVAPGCPGHDVPASCLVIRMEAVPSTRHLTDRPDTAMPRKTKHFRRGYANFAAGGLSAGGDRAPQWGAAEAEEDEEGGLVPPVEEGFRLAPVGFAALMAGRAVVGEELVRRKRLKVEGGEREGGGQGAATGAGETVGDKGEEAEGTEEGAAAEAVVKGKGEGASSSSLSASITATSSTTAAATAAIDKATSPAPSTTTGAVGGGATPDLGIFKVKAAGSEYMRQILHTVATEGSAAAIELGAGGGIGGIDGARNPADAAHSVVESVRMQAVQAAVQAAKAKAARAAAAAAAKAKGKEKEKEGGGSRSAGASPMKKAAAGPKPPQEQQQPVAPMPPLPDMPPLLPPPPPIPYPHLAPQQPPPPQAHNPVVLAALQALGVCAAMPPPHHHNHHHALPPHPHQRQHQQAIYTTLPPPTTAPAHAQPPPSLRQHLPPLPGLPPPPRFSYPGGQVAAEILRTASSSASSSTGVDAATSTTTGADDGGSTNSGSTNSGSTNSGSGSKRPRLGGAGVGLSSSLASALAPASAPAQGKPKGPGQGRPQQQQDRGTSPGPQAREGAAMALLSLAYWQ